MPSKAKIPTSSRILWSNYASAGALLFALVAASLRFLLLDWSDPYHCKALLTRGKWLDEGKFQNWQADGCMTYKYTQKDAQQCLKSKRVLFIGDSVARQLFFSLAHLADPSLPSAPPTSFEKHLDHSFASGQGTWFDFFWDPFLNTTRTLDVLRGVAYNKRYKPALLVLGSGLWYLRYAEDGTGGIASWEGNVEYLLNIISKSMPGLADEVVMTPVQEPVQEKLSSDRATFIHHGDIDAMNSDLTHRLASSSNTFNDQPVANPYPDSSSGHSSLRPPPLPVLFPSVFNDMLHPSQTEDGLHYSSTIVTAQAQILLNLRCNDVMPKTFPYNKTCCARYPYPSLVQIVLLAVVVLFGPFAVWLKGQSGRDGFADKSWAKNVIPSEENIGAVCTFGFAIGLCYISDRTGLFQKEQKQFNVLEFAALCLLALVGGMFTMRSGTKDLGFLNRDQTDEWKGWMQIVILIYHYLGASKILGIYALVRVLVASYLFMTGYGHTTFYLKKGDFSLQRVAQVLIRLNLLTVALAYVMNTDYLFYYFSPLVSFWYLVVYATLGIYSSYNSNTTALLCKILLSALLVLSFHSSPFFIEVVFGFLKTFANIQWDAKEWCFRINLDILIVYGGMLASILHSKFHQMRVVDHPRFAWIYRGALMISGLTLIWFFLFETSRKDKFVYNAFHPFISILPVTAYVLLRNATPVLRGASSGLFAFIGQCSLETFILQFHIWLAADTKGLLIMIPGVTWRPLNLLFTTVVFIWISYWVANATNILTKMIVGATNAKPAAGLPPPVTAPVTVSDLGIATEVEENIPLVHTVDGSSVQEPTNEQTDGLTNEKTANHGDEHASQTMQPQDGPIMMSVSGVPDGTQGVSQAQGSESQQHLVTVVPTPASAEIIATGSSILPFYSSLSARLSIILGTMWLLNMVWPARSLPLSQ